MHGPFDTFEASAVPLRPPLAWLLVMLAASLLVMAVAVATTHKLQSAMAAATFSLILVGSALRTNAPLWRKPSSQSLASPRTAVRQTAKLAMIAYLWSALAFYAIYIGTRLHWQHGWEYGTGLLLIGLGYAFYIWCLSDPKGRASSPLGVERAIRFSSYQAVLIALGLIWLIQSGKLASVRGDWPANQIFLAGGFAIMSISAILIKTYAALSERHPASSADQR